MDQLLIYGLTGLILGAIIMACKTVRAKMMERNAHPALRILAMTVTAAAIIVGLCMLAAALDTWVY